MKDICIADMGKTISILGLGWLGLPLAKSFLKKGYKVKGSVTSKEKQQELNSKNIETSVIKIDDNDIYVSNPSFFQTDILFINIPPRRIPNIETIYPCQIKRIKSFIHSFGIQKVIFISSTSVYPENGGLVTESLNLSPEKPSGKACLFAEEIIRNQLNVQITIIRFGGLIGANRKPHRFMKSGLNNGIGNIPINLIHLDDSIGIIHHIIENNIWNEVINGVCPIHPSRKEFYEIAAQISQIEKPLFEENFSISFKEVSAEKITKHLGYQFKYQSPIDYLNSPSY